jgi:hypothetical protein
MANSLSLKILNVGSTSSIYINDIHDGKDQNGRVNNRKPYQYIPANGAVTILFTEQVQYSYESGAIRSFIDQGLIQTFFLHGDLNYVSVDEDGVSYHLDVSFQNGIYEIVGGADDTIGTDILINAGNSSQAGLSGGAITIQAGIGQNANGGSLDINAGLSETANGGGVEIRGGEGDINGGGVFIAGNRGNTGTAGKVSLYGGDSNTDDGGDVELTGGPVWTANKEGGSVNLLGGIVIDDVVATGGHINITGGGVGNFIASSNGGDVNITSGAGKGAGRTSGDITLEPAIGLGGASDGKVVIKNYNDGLLVVSSEDVISSPYGRLAFLIDDGTHGTSVQLDSALITGSNPIIVTVEYPEVAGLTLDKVPYVASRNLVADPPNAIIKFDLNNQSGADQNCAINYMILA